MTTDLAWDIYAKSLVHLGYGYPLWMPDAVSDGSGSQIQVGDVGWLSRGSFRPLLRTRTTERDAQPHRVLPEQYQAFDPPNIVIDERPNAITQQMLFSRNMKSIEVSGGLSLNAPLTDIGAGGIIKFKCASDSGAMLLLSPRGEQTSIDSRRHIQTYICANIDKWITLATQTLGLDVRQEDLYFVSGVTKTSRWAVAAFRESQRDASGTISCNFGSLGSADLNLHIANVSLGNTWHRSGPQHARRHSMTQSMTSPSSISYTDKAASSTGLACASGSSASLSSFATADDGTEYSSHGVPLGPPLGHALSAPAAHRGSEALSDSADQCIFFNYYKMKRRRWPWSKMKAGARPHELPRPPDETDAPPGVESGDRSDSSGDESSEFELMPDYPKSYDPVNPLLDYILEVCLPAEAAIASNLDLYALFEENDFPDDMAGALAQLRPKIDTDEHGVGSLSEEITYSRRRPMGQLATSATEQTALAEHVDVEGTYEWLHPLHLRSHRSGQSRSRSVSPEDTSESVDDFSSAKQAAPFAIGDARTHEAAVTALAYSADGRYLASGSEDGSIIIWYTRERVVRRNMQAYDETISALAFSPDGALLAACSIYEPVRVWALDALDRGPQALNNDIFAHSLAFTPDGSSLIGGTTRDMLVAWDVDNFQCTTLSTDCPEPTFIVFSPNGRLMATGGSEASCRVWEAETLGHGEPKWLLTGHKGAVTSASFSPDSMRIVTGSEDRSCFIWSTETGLPLVELHEHAGPVWSVCFSPDGTRVASSSSDSTIKVCASWTGEQVLALQGHDNMVNAVTFSPDGRYIASASSDNTARLWNAADGSCLTTYNEHGDNVTSVLFAPEGQTLASGAEDGTVYIRVLPSTQA
ncbi:WD40 repeat-like protein [Pilatotrama ljubarskyi]|nr:WD40 repeat-like protein [Pilatotrama ljubarskyi]